ncbi:MAG TPA: cyclic nucleotide-binding domain-containing protein, partial [Vicinamibacteria bacterium]|nr:cyclic nucleotide-binding domain-containing protein [Vicinamibacteria bacterium]
RDWLVFEAASWALAAQRMPAEARRSRWREPLPAVVAADRLRRIPLLRFASVGHLLHVAGAGRTVRPEPGRTLVQRGAAATGVDLVLEGAVSVQDGEAPPIERLAPLALGLEAVLGGERQRESVRAGEGVVCLTIGAGDFLGLLSEEMLLVRRIFRAILEGGLVEARALPPRRPAAAPEPAGAQILEAVHVLEASPLFARATPDQLLQLARIARAVPLEPGSIFFDEADPAALYVMASGEARIETEGAPPVPARSGDTLGVLESLAGIRGGRARAGVRGSVLQIEAEALLALLAGDAALLQGVFGALFERARL